MKVIMSLSITIGIKELLKRWKIRCCTFIL